MVTITIQRRNSNEICTTGMFKAVSTEKEGIITGYTLEPPWRDNKRGESCIPAGEYKAYIRRSGSSKWKYDIIQLERVPDREYIQIHGGNKPEHTQGCILAGSMPGKNAVWKSWPKVEELVNFCEGEDVVVIIKDVV